MIRSLLDRAWRTFFTGSAFLFFFVGGVLLSYLVLPLACIRAEAPAEKARRCRRIVGWAWVLFHDYMRVARLLRYDPRRTALRLPPGPFVMIANHPTLVDVTALVATHPNMVIVVKRAMYRSPLLGRLLRYCGHIDAGDGGVFSGVAVMARALERLDDGISVLIFPEGTRSPERGLGRFQAGAFQIATRAQVPVVPVVITCEPPMLMRGQPWYSVPARTAEMRVTQLPSIPLNGDDPGLQAERIRDLFAERVLATAGALPPIDLSTSPALVAGP